MVVLIRALCLLLVATPAYAGQSAGAPMYLLISFPLFTVGLLWTVLSEAWVIQRHLPFKFSESVWFTSGVNIASGMVIAVGLPFAVGFASGIGAFMPGEPGQLWSALGTWVFPDSDYRRLAMWMTIPWSVLALLLTVKFETWYITRLLQKREVSPPATIKKICWIANIISHGGLALFATILGWHYYSSL